MMEKEDSPSKIQMFLEKLSQLEQLTEAEQKQKIEEMNEMIDEMDKEEFKSIFNKETFNKMDKMIDEKKLSMRNATWLLKHVGYCQMLRCIFDYAFNYSFLSDRFQEMIIEEEEKKEGKNERLLIDLCECYLLFYNGVPSSKLFSICVPCLLEVALKKEESEETRKEVEMALLALSNIPVFYEVKRELSTNKIKEIIKYHQEHHNLTRLGCQSAWLFLINRLLCNRFLEDIVVNELHFGREAARELEELSRCVEWKRKKEEKRERERKAIDKILRWFELLNTYFLHHKSWNEEFAGLLSSVAQLFRASRDNYRDIGYECINSFRNAESNRHVKVDDLLKGGAIDAVFEGIHQSTVDDQISYDCLEFFYLISRRLKKVEDYEMEEEERKTTKRKVFEKMEEEGYEDFIASLCVIFDFLNDKYGCGLPHNISKYFTNV